MKIPCFAALGSLLSLCLLAGCAAEKKEPAAAAANPNAIQRNDLAKSYGLPFEIKPVSAMKPAVQKAAEAVVFVRYADGGYATGFFISDDGLLMTNNHVVNREECLRQRCAGIQLIRDFRPGGALEVFDDFEFLAASAESDLSLVRVKLPPGRKVPFLRLGATAPTKDDSLLLVGHPGGSTLHVSASRLRQARTRKAQFLSLAVGGNSGGPVLDAKTLEVVAVIHSINRHDERIDRTGVSTLYAMGELMTTLERTFKAADPSFSIANPRFQAPAASALTAAQAEVVAPSKHEGPSTVARLVRTGMGTPQEAAMLASLLGDHTAKTFGKEDLNGALDVLVYVDLNRGKKLPVTAELLKAHQPEGYVPANIVNAFYLGKAPADCLKEASEYPGAPEFEYLGDDCLQTADASGTDALKMLRALVEKEKGKAWGEDHEKFNSSLLLGIEYQLLLRSSLSKEDSDLVKFTLKKIGTDAPSMRQYFGADRLLTLLADKPVLVGPGSYKGL